MGRFLVDVPADDVRKLDEIALREGKSRAAAIRDAVKLYLVHNADNNDWIERWAGLWEHRDDIPDGVEYQQAMREDRRPYEDI